MNCLRYCALAYLGFFYAEGTRCWVKVWNWPNDSCAKQECAQWQLDIAENSWSACCQDHCKGSGLNPPEGAGDSLNTQTEVTWKQAKNYRLLKGKYKGKKLKAMLKSKRRRKYLNVILEKEKFDTVTREHVAVALEFFEASSSTASPTPSPASPDLDDNGNSDSINDPSGNKYVVYYPSWATYVQNGNRNFQISEIDGSHLTHINYAFANIANGECVLGDPYADTEKLFANSPHHAGSLGGNFNQLIELKKKYPHVATMISIGGWTWSSHFSDVASTDAKRVKFAESCTRFMETYGFDGIDVDWEFPVVGGNGIPQGAEDKENFTLLLRALRSAMDALSDGVHHPLTIATSANPNRVTVSYDIPAVDEVVDFVNVMTYDFNGHWDATTGHNAPLYPNARAAIPEFNIQDAVEAYLEAGLRSKKLVLGLAFYGRGWSSVGAGDGDGLFAHANGASPGSWKAEDGLLDYKDLVANYIDKNGYTRHWDAESSVPYLYNPDQQIFITYDDEQSICMKAGFIMKHGLGGAMVWEVTSDYKQRLQKLSYGVVVGGADACNLD